MILRWAYVKLIGDAGTHSSSGAQRALGVFVRCTVQYCTTIVQYIHRTVRKADGVEVGWERRLAVHSTVPCIDAPVNPILWKLKLESRPLIWKKAGSKAEFDDTSIPVDVKC